MNENFYKKLGKRIRSLRTEKSLTQDNLAELAGIHPKFAGKIERAEKKPSLDTIIKISNALNIEAKELFDFNK